MTLFSRPQFPDTTPCLPFFEIACICRWSAFLILIVAGPLTRERVNSYGGIFEKGSREYTLDDFHSIQLDKLDKYTCLKKSDVVISTADEESSSDEGEDDDDDDDEDEDREDDDEDDRTTLASGSPLMSKKEILDVDDIIDELELTSIKEEDDVREIVAEENVQEVSFTCYADWLFH